MVNDEAIAVDEADSVIVYDCSQCSAGNGVGVVVSLRPYRI